MESLESRTVLSAVPLAALTEIGATIRAESLRNLSDFDPSPTFAEVGRPFVAAPPSVHGEMGDRVIAHDMNAPLSASPLDRLGAPMPSRVGPSSFLWADRNVLADRLEHRLAGFPPIPAFQTLEDQGLGRAGSRFLSFNEVSDVKSVRRDSLASSRRDTLYVDSSPGLAAASSSVGSAYEAGFVRWMADFGLGPIDSYVHEQAPLGTDVVAGGAEVPVPNGERGPAVGRLSSLLRSNDTDTSQELAGLFKRMHSLTAESGTEGGLVDIRSDEFTQTDSAARETRDLTNLTKSSRRKSSTWDSADTIWLDSDRRSTRADERVQSRDLNPTSGTRYAPETLTEGDAASSFRRDRDSDEGGMIELVAGTFPAEAPLNATPSPLPLDTKTIQMDAGLGLFQSLEVAAGPMDGDGQRHSVSTATEVDASAEQTARSDGLTERPVNRALTVPSVLVVASLLNCAARRRAQEDSLHASELPRFRNSAGDLPVQRLNALLNEDADS
jgi:hypothetical protein